MVNSPAHVTIERITGNIGAVIGGIDMRQPMPAETVALFRQAWLDHGVVFLRGQDITPDQYWAFLENFGQPHREESHGSDDDTAADVMTADLGPSRHSTAVWHADTTSLATPPIATALRAVDPPPFGGDTCWSSMYAAWNALSEPMQRMLDGLHAVHTVQLTVDRMGDYAVHFESAYRAKHPDDQIHPVVLTHPETGRKALYVNESFVTRIVELDRLESAAVLAMLFRHVERPDFCMRWHWQANDIAFWDNRCVQHYAVPDYTASRVMQRIVLAGVKPGEPSAFAPRGRGMAA